MIGGSWRRGNIVSLLKYDWRISATWQYYCYLSLHYYLYFMSHSLIYSSHILLCSSPQIAGIDIMSLLNGRRRFKTMRCEKGGVRIEVKESSGALPVVAVSRSLPTVHVQLYWTTRLVKNIIWDFIKNAFRHDLLYSISTVQPGAVQPSSSMINTIETHKHKHTFQHDIKRFV